MSNRKVYDSLAIAYLCILLVLQYGFLGLFELVYSGLEVLFCYQLEKMLVDDMMDDNKQQNVW